MVYFKHKIYIVFRSVALQKSTYTWQKDDRFSVTTDTEGIDLYKMAELIKEHDWTVCDRPVVFMLDCVFKKHPVFRKMRRVNLITPNASGLYAKYGFRPASHPEEYMERNTSYEEAYADYFDRKRTNI